MHFFKLACSTSEYNIVKQQLFPKKCSLNASDLQLPLKPGCPIVQELLSYTEFELRNKEVTKSVTFHLPTGLKKEITNLHLVTFTQLSPLQYNTVIQRCKSRWMLRIKQLNVTMKISEEFWEK